MGLVSFSQLISSPTTTSELSVLQSFFASPILTIIFAPIMVLGGLGLIVGLLLWMFRRFSHRNA